MGTEGMLMVRKVVLMLALSFTCNSAIAEWTAVDESSSLFTYIDYSTILKNDNMVKMWTLYDYKSPQEGVGGKQYLSTKSRDEYDCKEVKARRLSLSVYTGSIGQGEVLYADSIVNAWVEVPPDVIGKTQWEIACGKQEANLKSN